MVSHYSQSQFYLVREGESLYCSQNETARKRLEDLEYSTCGGCGGQRFLLWSYEYEISKSTDSLNLQI